MLYTVKNAVDQELKEIQEIIDTVKSDSETRVRYMGIMGVIDYERRDAFEDGQIIGTITTCKSLNLDRTKTKELLLKQYDITDDKVEEYLNLYW